jgi:transcriptional regulator with XRE-family HTH domain
MSEVRAATTARETTLAAVAAEVHSRRTALRLSVRAAAKRCRVSPTVIFEVENRQRVPSLVTYEKLREGLGLTAPAIALIPPRGGAGLLEDHLAARVKSSNGP